MHITADFGTKGIPGCFYIFYVCVVIPMARSELESGSAAGQPLDGDPELTEAMQVDEAACAMAAGTTPPPLPEAPTVELIVDTDMQPDTATDPEFIPTNPGPTH